MDRPAAEREAHEDDDSSWGFAAAEEIVPGVHACALLGSGRRCETWLAWCVRRWSPVALKLPRRDCLADERTHAALRREAATAASLSHPSVLRLLDAPQDPFPHLLFEYVEGPTLAQAIDEDGELAPADVARLGMQLAAALHYLHGEGVVHLDLKPGNVALRDGRAVILDLDLARKVGEQGSGLKPRGTPAWMAPEQVRCVPAAPSMDLFALGAVLYEAATGEQAFHPRSKDVERAYPQLTERPAPFRAVAPQFPAELARVIWALLEPDPARRPASAMDALAMLARALPAGEEGLWPGWASGLMPGR